MYPGKFDSLFLNNPDNDHDATVHLIRVCHLTEMLYNNQWLKEYAACIKQFRTPTQIESTYAELDIARLMIATKVKFALNERTFKKGSDFDLLITFPNGLTACGETKCKVETTTLSEGTLTHSLEDARDRNLPDDRPGIVFAKLPAEWIKDGSGQQMITRAVNRFLGSSPNIVSVKCMTSAVMSDGVKTREVLSWMEYPNQDNRFDPRGDWRLFPRTWESSSDWNGMPPHWRRILKGDWL